MSCTIPPWSAVAQAKTKLPLFCPQTLRCCDTGSADVLVRSGSERGRSRSHVECLFSSVTHQGITGQSLMTWDADGNRISLTSSTNPGNPHTFVYDTTAGIPAVIEEVKPSGATGGSGTVYYIREPGGALIARIAGTGTGQTTQYYHFDALGSTRLLTNSTGAVTDTYSYDAWGNPLSTPTQDTRHGYVGSLGYYTEPDTGLMKLGARYYDPSTGRFITQDPVRDGLNWYAYAENDPVNQADPTGLRAITANDKTRLRTLYNYAGQRNVSVHMVNQLVAELKSKISAAGTSSDPESLRATWWAIDRLGNTQNHSKVGTLDNTYVADLGKGTYKCSAFVANAYALGAGLGWGEDGVPVKQRLGIGNPHPPTANDMADPKYDMSKFYTIRYEDLQSGDLYAWQGFGGGPGHCGIYLGMGISVSASPEGVRLANMNQLNGTTSITYRRYGW